MSSLRQTEAAPTHLPGTCTCVRPACSDQSKAMMLGKHLFVLFVATAPAKAAASIRRMPSLKLRGGTSAVTAAAVIFSATPASGMSASHPTQSLYILPSRD